MTLQDGLVPPSNRSPSNDSVPGLQTPPSEDWAHSYQAPAVEGIRRNVELDPPVPADMVLGMLDDNGTANYEIMYPIEHVPGWFERRHWTQFGAMETAYHELRPLQHHRLVAIRLDTIRLVFSLIFYYISERFCSLCFLSLILFS